MAVRRVLYTTNAIESLHRPIRNVIMSRGHFHSDERASKLLNLAPRNFQKKRRVRAAPVWGAAFPHLKLRFGSRLPEDA